MLDLVSSRYPPLSLSRAAMRVQGQTERSVSPTSHLAIVDLMP